MKDELKDERIGKRVISVRFFCPGKQRIFFLQHSESATLAYHILNYLKHFSLYEQPVKLFEFCDNFEVYALGHI